MLCAFADSAIFDYLYSGLPPNQFGSTRGGKGKGSKPPQFVPPVHSLAKARPAVLDIENMSLAEKVCILRLEAV